MTTEEQSDGNHEPTRVDIARFRSFATYHRKNGARTFADWSRRMVAQFDEVIRPYLGDLRPGTGFWYSWVSPKVLDLGQRSTPDLSPHAPTVREPTSASASSLAAGKTVYAAQGHGQPPTSTEPIDARPDSSPSQEFQERRPKGLGPEEARFRRGTFPDPSSQSASVNADDVYPCFPVYQRRDVVWRSGAPSIPNSNEAN